MYYLNKSANASLKHAARQLLAPLAHLPRHLGRLRLQVRRLVPLDPLPLPVRHLPLPLLDQAALLVALLRRPPLAAVRRPHRAHFCEDGGCVRDTLRKVSLRKGSLRRLPHTDLL